MNFANATIEQRKVVFHGIFDSLIAAVSCEIQKGNMRKNWSDKRHDCTVVLVEPRQHEFAKGVLANALHAFRSKPWNLRIVTSTSSREFYCSLFPDIDLTIATLPPEQQDLSLKEYSKLLTSAAFWNAIPEENILIIQTDTLILNSHIEDFMQYDFIGANYFNPADQAIWSGGMNGGFSFRHRSAMLRCLGRSIADLLEYRLINGKFANVTHFHEDVFFTHAAEVLMCRLCRIEERPQFSIEDGRPLSEQFPCPVGCHRFASPELAHIMPLLLRESEFLSQFVPAALFI